MIDGGSGGQIGVLPTGQAIRLAKAQQISGAELLNHLVNGQVSIPVADLPTIEDGKIKDWEPAYREVKEAWDRLRADFLAQASGLAASGGSGRWREIVLDSGRIAADTLHANAAKRMTATAPKLGDLPNIDLRT